MGVWETIFLNETSKLRPKYADRWRLQFDNSIVPDNPDYGWKQYIRNTCAWFRCSGCGRRWPSNRAMVVFHMRLTDGQGIVKMRRLRQECKICVGAQMEIPRLSSENIEILMANLVKKIRVKCYHEKWEKKERSFVEKDVRSPHEPDHCEACKHGICEKFSKQGLS